MKNVMLLLLLSFVMSSARAQAVVPPNIRAENNVEHLSDANGMSNADLLYGIPMPPGKVIGDTYLNDNWRKSTILLYEDERLIENYPVRYDIRLDELEIKAKNGIKILPGAKIKSFVWLDSLTGDPSYFVNAKEYKNEDDVSLTGFFQVLADGELPLFKRSFISIKKADYNIQFNVGSHDDKILKKTRLYTAIQNKVIELPASKKKLIALFPDKGDEMEKFMKSNDLASNREDHLTILFDHYNSLVNHP